MSTKKSRRKDAKRKKRQDSIRQSKHLAKQAEARKNQARRSFHKAHEELYRQMDRLEAETLLDAIGISVDSSSTVAAVSFIGQCMDFEEVQGNLSGSMDELFLIAHGLPSRRYPDAHHAQLLRLLVRDMQRKLKSFERRVDALLGTDIGRRVYETDDIESRMAEACMSRRDELIELDRRFSVRDREAAPEDLEPPEYDDDPENAFQAGSQNMIDKVSQPVEKIERFRLGVPRDFFQDVVDTLGAVGMNAALFYLRELYEDMAKKDFLGRGLRDEPIERFRAVLNVSPEMVLPEPDLLQALKEAALRFNAIGLKTGGSGLSDALQSLRARGLALGEAMARLESLPRHAGTGKVLQCLASEGFRTLDAFLDNPEFFEAFEVLSKVDKDPARIAMFLEEYGDYPVNGSTLAGIINRNRNNPAIVQTIRDNALHLCCDDSSASMMAALEEQGKGAYALRQYIRLGVEELPFKQLAVLKYVRERGTGRLRDFISGLEGYEDLAVGELLMRDDCIDLIEAGFRPDVSDPMHRLKQMANFDLVMRYSMAPEIHRLEREDLSKLDSAMERVRGTIYEAVLLGQPSLRRKAIEQLLRGELSLDCLPAQGNAYAILRKRMSKEAAIAPEGSVMAEHSRIILVSDRVDDETALFIQEKAGCPVSLLSTKSSARRFDGIREGDLVLYDTTKSGHSTYYLVKNLAFRRGAGFRHASRTSKEALLELI